MKSVVFALVFFASNLAFAQSSTSALAYCEIAGAAYGSGKTFVGSMAARIAENAGFDSMHPQCGPIWREAYQTAQRLATGEVKSQADWDLAMRMQAFERKVLDAIIQKLQLTK
jgi:hypothetical protein